jgi:hypothetical protein
VVEGIQHKPWIGILLHWHSEARSLYFPQLISPSLSQFSRSAFDIWRRFSKPPPRYEYSWMGLKTTRPFLGSQSNPDYSVVNRSGAIRLLNFTRTVDSAPFNPGIGHQKRASWTPVWTPNSSNRFCAIRTVHPTIYLPENGIPTGVQAGIPFAYRFRISSLLGRAIELMSGL